MKLLFASVALVILACCSQKQSPESESDNRSAEVSPSPNATPDSKYHPGDVVLFKADPTLKGVIIKVEMRGPGYRYTVKWSHPSNKNLFSEDYAKHYELMPVSTPSPSPTPLFGSTPIFSSPPPSTTTTVTTKP